MSAVPYAEYVLREEQSETRHEYVDGEILAVPPSTPAHSALAASVLALIGRQLPHGCRAFTCNLRIRIIARNVATYADGAVTSGPTVRATDDAEAITNPVVLVEITSNSTERYDRTRKLDSYKTIESLQEVLIVSHREPWLTLHRRMTDRSWIVLEARAGESVSLESVAATLNVDDVYTDELTGIA